MQGRDHVDRPGTGLGGGSRPPRTHRRRDHSAARRRPLGDLRPLRPILPGLAAHRRALPGRDLVVQPLRPATHGLDLPHRRPRGHPTTPGQPDQTVPPRADRLARARTSAVRAGIHLPGQARLATGHCGLSRPDARGDSRRHPQRPRPLNRSEKHMLSLLTVNIGAASRERAGSLLTWLAKRSEDVFLLTETSAGTGTDYLLGQFRTAGYAVVHTLDRNGGRGTALVSRVKLHAEPFEHFADASLPGRLAGAVLDTEPRLAVLSVYVPSRDRTLDKTEKKQTFIASLLAGLDAMPDELRGRLIIGGDYNV